MSERFFVEEPIRGETAKLITRLEKQGVTLKILERHEPQRELPFELTLAVALPKGDRQKWLMEKGTELGVAKLIPLITKRGVAQPVDSALARLARQSIEAAKQCGRNRLMEVEPPQTAEAFFSGCDTNFTRWIAHPGGAMPAESGWLDESGKPRGALMVAFGPEGGFSDEEVEHAVKAGWKQVSLGSRILRIETAAVAIAAWAGMAGTA